MTSEKNFQKKLPDIRSKLDSMSRNQTVADAVEDAKTLVEDVLEYARSEIDKAKLNITETGGVLPQRSKIEKIVKKFNRNGEFSEIKNAELTDDIMAIMTDYMNGAGSSDTLLNLLSDTLYTAKLNTYDVLGTETFVTKKHRRKQRCEKAKQHRKQSCVRYGTNEADKRIPGSG